MKIRLGYDGCVGETGARFTFSAVVDVADAQEAELIGREFGTLTHHLEVGIVEAQRVAYGVPPE